MNKFTVSFAGVEVFLEWRTGYAPWSKRGLSPGLRKAPKLGTFAAPIAKAIVYSESGIEVNDVSFIILSQDQKSSSYNIVLCPLSADAKI